MASLQEIAREQAENLRTGAVWVIVWKTGRSWRAETVSLNRKTRLWGSMEDKERASAIIQADSQKEAKKCITQFQKRWKLSR